MAGHFVNNLDRFITILWRFQNFNCLQKRKNFYYFIFAETPLNPYLLIFNEILISHLKDSYYLLPSVSDPAKVDNSVGFQ